MSSAIHRSLSTPHHAFRIIPAIPGQILEAPLRIAPKLHHFCTKNAFLNDLTLSRITPSVQKLPPFMHPQATINQFIDLRTQGFSLSRIAGQLGVSKRTLIDWNRKRVGSQFRELLRHFLSWTRRA